MRLLASLNIFSLPLTVGTGGLIVQVNATCGESFSYRLNGREAEYAGNILLGSSGDSRTRSFEFGKKWRSKGGENSHCVYTLHVLATTEFQDAFLTNGPIIFSIAVSSCFFVFAIVFFSYDWAVRRRQNNLLHTAERTNAIVSNLFPKDVRERIMADADEQAGNINALKRPSVLLRQTGTGQIKELLADSTTATSIFKTKPIADLFPEVTVMFADLVGFTAWSSTREPAQVFTLLETIYHEFDQIAQRRRVFKVETVGDCYVAVAGLPEYHKDHATIMVNIDILCISSAIRHF